MSQAARAMEIPLTERVRRIALEGEVALPPMPEIGQRLISLLRDEENADARKIAETVYTDPAIAAALLRMANSAYFSGLNPVTDLGQAIARLGLKRVGSLATTLLHKGQFESRRPDRRPLLAGLWSHSVASALACRYLADYTGANLEESYLAGLLHDIGKLLALKALDQIALEDEEIEVTRAVIEEVLSTVHAELGHLVLTQWKLPETICNAVLLHHTDPADVDDFLALRIQAADAITRHIGAHMTLGPTLPLEEEPAIERFNLTEVELAALIVDLEDELTKLRAFL